MTATEPLPAVVQPAAEASFALVGAGPIGLCVARALAQRGIPYVQFETANEVGGNWRDGVYETAHIISSRKTTEFSDYPMPASYPDFPSAAQMLAYLRDYARHYDLEQNIVFGTTVTGAAPVVRDGAERWELTFADGERRVYKGVIACVGHHWDRRWPSYPGTFSGELIHSKDYKSPEQLRGKRVLTIGGGNSACDIASEAARVGASSHLSNRRGYWFLPKTMFGVPVVELVKPWMPLWLQRIFLRAVLAVTVGDYGRYGLQRPDHAIFEHHPTLNSELLHYIKHGRITPHPDIVRYDGDEVEFADGTRERFDLIVAATGFHQTIPFLSRELVPVEGPIVKLYGSMMSDRYRNLYVFGWAQARYGFGPIVSPGADLLAEVILAQARMRFPIGAVLKKMGAKLPSTHLVDPHGAIRQIERARKRLPMLVKMEKVVMRNQPEPAATA
ncbi:MAG TPA: NAD(P)-binding domain-containing protein [Candidatus Elarobacter sp.]